MFKPDRYYLKSAFLCLFFFCLLAVLLRFVDTGKDETYAGVGLVHFNLALQLAWFPVLNTISNYLLYGLMALALVNPFVMALIKNERIDVPLIITYFFAWISYSGINRLYLCEGPSIERSSFPSMQMFAACLILSTTISIYQTGEITLGCIIAFLLMLLLRFFCGEDWPTDIIGAILLGAVFFNLYHAFPLAREE